MPLATERATASEHGPLAAPHTTAPGNERGRLDFGHSPVSPPDLEESFDEAGAATELIEQWRELEESSFNDLGRQRSLCAQSRSAVLSSLLCLVDCKALSKKAWFQAADLLDRCADEKDDLACTCVAVMGIIAKGSSIGDSAACSVTTGAAHAGFIQNALQSAGLRCSPQLRQAAVRARERSILEALKWRTTVPTLESWSSALIVRLNVLSHGLLKESLDWVQECTTAYSCRLVLRSDRAQRPAARHLATGLVVLGLACAQLVSPADLWPAASEPASLAWLEGAPSCKLPPRLSRALFGHLLTAACCDREELQEACKLAAEQIEALFGRPWHSCLLA